MKKATKQNAKPKRTPAPNTETGNDTPEKPKTIRDPLIEAGSPVSALLVDVSARFVVNDPPMESGERARWYRWLSNPQTRPPGTSNDPKLCESLKTFNDAITSSLTLWELHWHEKRAEGATHSEIAKSWKRTHPREDLDAIVRKSKNEVARQRRLAAKSKESD